MKLLHALCADAGDHFVHEALARSVNDAHGAVAVDQFASDGVHQVGLTHPHTAIQKQRIITARGVGGDRFGSRMSKLIAGSDDERIVREYPTFLIGLTPTVVKGELGFGFVAWERTSFVRRDEGKDFAGTTTTLWAIAAAVYLALAGPEGLRDLGTGIVQGARYAAGQLAKTRVRSAARLSRGLGEWMKCRRNGD